MPLFVQYKHLLYPQMGLATACVMLGANPAAMRFEGSNIIIPTSGKPVVIPTFTYRSKALGRSVPLIAALPWFGTARLGNDVRLARASHLDRPYLDRRYLGHLFNAPDHCVQRPQY